MTSLLQSFFFFFFTFVCHANKIQSQGWFFTCRANRIHIDQDCKLGREAAINDFVNDQSGYYFYGLPNPKFNTWKRIIQKDLRLTSKGGGCILDEEGICYNDCMRILLKDKYGDSIFEEISARVDSLYALGLGDQVASFKNGIEDVNQYFYCNIDQGNFSKKDKTRSCIIKAIIDREGIMLLDTIYFKNMPNDLRVKLERTIEELTFLMPLWTPAIEYMKAVPSNWNIPILFTEQERLKWCP